MIVGSDTKILQVIGGRSDCWRGLHYCNLKEGFQPMKDASLNGGEVWDFVVANWFGIGM